MVLTYTKAFEQANPANPSGTPLLRLGFKGRNDKEYDIGYGVRKYQLILANMDLIKADIDAWDMSNGMFAKEYVFDADSKFPFKDTFTIKKWSIIDHYRAEIQAYIDKYYVPYVPKNRMCISEPRTELYETEKCDVKWRILIPCYKKQEGDEGEGLRPWSITEWLSSFLVKDAEGGKLYNNVVKFMKEHPNESYKPQCDYDIEFVPEQLQAFVKYYDLLLKFTLNPAIV